MGTCAHVDGVMLGRAAYHEPEILLAVDPELFGEAPPVADAFEAIEAYEPYVAARLAEGRAPSHHHAPHARPFHRPSRRAGLSPSSRDRGVKPGANLQTLRDAVAHVSRETVQAWTGEAGSRSE